LKEGPWLFAK
jgi:hypothetical protein